MLVLFFPLSAMADCPALYPPWAYYYAGTVTVVNNTPYQLTDVLIHCWTGSGFDDAYGPANSTLDVGQSATISGFYVGGTYQNSWYWQYPVESCVGVARSTSPGLPYVNSTVIGFSSSCGVGGVVYFGPAPIDDRSDLNKKRPCDRGMPVWSVSEPNISLWLHDEPLGYQPGIGSPVSFEVAFAQRESISGFDPNVFGVGKRCNCSWLSYVSRDPNGNNVVLLSGGGQRTYYGSIDYLTNTRLTGDITNGFTLYYPDGSQDVYGFIVNSSLGTFQKAFLTERLNSQSQAVQLNYFPYSASLPVIRLKSVVDGDGGTNWVYYSTNNPYSTNLITQVSDRFGRFATLGYDNFGHLTNITDVAGISSALLYDGNDWVTNLTTPYGSTSFSITDSSVTNAPNGRSVLVTEPDGGHELYLYQENALGITNSYPSTAVPSITNFTTTFDTNNLDRRNSFHWNRLQYGALSTTTVSSFTNKDFRIAKMRHWLSSANALVGETLSMERAASPEGSSEGQKTWYDYAGKTNAMYEGTQALPFVVAEVLPDGSTSYIRTDRNTNGFATTEIGSYSSGAAIAVRTKTLAYAVNGVDLVGITNALGIQVSSNAYNGFHQVVTNYDGLGEVTVFSYNGNQQLSSVLLPSGLISTSTYFTSGSASNRLSTTVDSAIIGGSPVYYTNSYTWTNGLIVTHTDPLGLTVANTWDNLQRLRRIDFPDSTYITNGYTNLDLVQVVDRMGFTSSLGYDSVRHLVAATNANGVVTRYGYCTCGALSAVTNAFGSSVQAVTTYSWDLQGHKIQSLGPDLNTVTYNYNASGQLTNVTDGLSSVITTFNNQGLPISSSNALGLVSASIYDILDRGTNTVDANGVTVTNTFDNLNRLLTRGYPDGGVERFAYTLNIGSLTSYTNQLNTNVVNYVYDPLGRKTAEVYPGIATNSFGYDAVGNLVSLTDGKNQVTTWHYDQYGRATNKVDATSSEILRYGYDPDNRLTSRWSAAKGATAYSFDSAGNLLAVMYPHSGTNQYSYDVRNRLTNMVDGVGTTRYGYTSAGLLSSEDGPWSDDTVSYSYSYQRLRNSLSLQAPNASPWNQSYNYDTAERLSTVSSPAGAFNYGYDGTRQMQVASLTLPSGAFITNAFDSVARLLSTTLKNASLSTLNSHQYSYNAASQRTYLTNTSGDYRSYTYDNIGQVTAALGYEPGGTNRFNERFNYQYDSAGNLTLRIYPSGNSNPLTEALGVNNLNELSSINRTGSVTVAGTTTSPATNVTVNALTATLYVDSTFARTNVPTVNGTNTYTAIAWDSYGRIDTNTITAYLPTNVFYSYDLNGNLTNDGTRNFAYDDENQLTSVSVTNNWRSDFVYDGKMRRRWRFESTWNGSTWVTNTTVRYVYDGNLVIQERDANNLPLVSYTRGRDLSGSLQGAGGIGGLLARTDHSALAIGSPNAHAFYHADGNGNVTALINTSQSIVAKYLYDPFGNILSKSGSLADANLYRFSSKEFHQNSGLSYYLYRFYDPSLQRWLNRDPANEVGGVNLYAFVGNNPVNVYDPMGLQGGLNALFWQSVYENGLSDASAFARRLGQDAESMGKGLLNRALDPLGAVMNDYQTVVKASSKAGELAGDRCKRDRARKALEKYAASPEAYADAVVFVDSLLAAKALAPEAEANVAAEGIPQVTAKGLARVEAHLDDVLADQFSDFSRADQLTFQAGERGMLDRLRSGATSSQDIEFYMHELKESARFRATGNLMDGHNAALQWRNVTSQDLFHPDVIGANPSVFPPSWQHP